MKDHICIQALREVYLSVLRVIYTVVLLFTVIGLSLVTFAVTAFRGGEYAKGYMGEIIEVRPIRWLSEVMEELF